MSDLLAISFLRRGDAFRPLAGERTDSPSFFTIGLSRLMTGRSVATDELLDFVSGPQMLIGKGLGEPHDLCSVIRWTIDPHASEIISVVRLDLAKNQTQPLSVEAVRDILASTVADQKALSTPLDTFREAAHASLQHLVKALGVMTGHVVPGGTVLVVRG